MNTPQGRQDRKPRKQVRLVDFTPCETIVLKRELQPKPSGDPSPTRNGLATEFLAMRQQENKKKQLQERLRHAQKMEAVGQLASGVAHDFNNILMAIQMGLGMLRDAPEMRTETIESIKELERETARGANLTRQLLVFTRSEARQREAVNLNQLVNDMLVMMRRLLGENLEILFQGSLDPLWIRADAGMIEQIVLNLCLNARDAMPHGGRLMIATGLRDTRQPFERPDPAGCAPRYVCLSVSDTGCGMEPAVLEKIFEPFFTTKEVGKGTGLGLATVYGIVKQHQGWVEVDSVVGRGSSFRVVLPEASAREDREVASGPPAVVGGSETILLVEDENSVRRLVAAWLQKLGYRILEAGDAAAALAIWERRHQEISLLLTDTMMPGNLTGLELAELLKAEQPSLKIISSSGYDAGARRSNLKPGEDIIHLTKPYSPETLASAVRQCLDQTEGEPQLHS